MLIVPSFITNHVTVLPTMFDTSFQTMADSSFPTMTDGSFPTANPTQTASPGFDIFSQHHHHHHYNHYHKPLLVLHVVIGILGAIVLVLTALSVFLIIQMRRRAATIKVTAEDLEPIGLPRAMTLEQAQREEMWAQANGQHNGTVLNGEKTVLGPIVEGKE